VTKKIGIQGGKGSFNEQAALRLIEKHKLENNSQIEFLISSEAVLKAVETNAVDIGLFAMENAQGGVVIESVKALAKYRCHIIDMFHIEIQQNLLALPGTQVKDIKAIYSHQQALRQCRNYLSENFWGVELIEADDTAESARRLAASELQKNSAVIANKACVELYGLELIEADIHDLKKNFTLFIAVEKLEKTS